MIIPLQSRLAKMRQEIARRYTKIVLAIMSRDKKSCKIFCGGRNVITEVGVEYANSILIETEGTRDRNGS